MELYFGYTEGTAQVFKEVKEWGLTLLYGAIDALLAPPSLKELKSQTSSGRDGVEPYNLSGRMYDKRDFSLSFAQSAESLALLYQKQRELHDVLKSGVIFISVPSFAVTFRCALKSFDSYSVNTSKMVATFKLSFTEFNPSDTNRSYIEPTSSSSSEEVDS